ncbi:ATP-binding protein [Roseateles sp.]|jgi:signal transduction histidine kinase|uniref:ATP-binding protein n=1 Tax=Roseateles sp. TaxID=1971397 RepID=UPI00391913D9
MDLFIDEASYLILARSAGRAGASVAERLALCWHQRQRDPAAALVLSAQLRPLVPEVGCARLDLVQAELALLQMDFLLLDQALERARQAFEAADDALGLADCDWLEAWRASSEGRQTQALPRLESVRRRAGAQSQRAQAASLWADLLHTFADPLAGRARGAPSLEQIGALPVGVDAWAHELRGTLAAQASDYGRAAGERLLAFEKARNSGQLHRAVVAIHNAVDALNNLGIYEQSLQWMEHALELLRPRAWPMLEGHSLTQLGDTLRRLGRLDQALQALDEALDRLGGLPASRPYAILLKCRGDLLLDRAEAEPALQTFEQLQAHGQARLHPDLGIHALRGEAQALSLLGRGQAALGRAHAALQRARDSAHVYRQIESLRALARLHADHPELQPDEPSRAPSPALHYLLQAQQLAGTLAGFTPPGELWDELADAWAASGDMAQAYRLCRLAEAARRRSQTDQAAQRVLAMQVLHETEQARAEAAEQARRADRLDREMAQRVQQGKLQALSRLVAGVAHELNTPLGNSLMAASNLQSRADELHQALQEQQLRRSALETFLDQIRSSGALLTRNLARAASLVEQFKQLAVSSDARVRQRLRLRPLCEQLLHEFQGQLASAPDLRLTLGLEVDPRLVLSSDPVALQQLLAELLVNARLHAFAGRSQGRLSLRAAIEGERGLRLSLQDDGCGITADNLPHVFDPFFSTRFGQGRSGLGLHICHNLALARLGGTLSVSSEPGMGCCFTLLLPEAGPELRDEALSSP